MKIIGDIHGICLKYGIDNYTINVDESIDVDENVHLRDKRLIELPLKFRNVSGYFLCSDNSLSSLVGCPKSVSGAFSCRENKITSLKGCPKSIGSYFDCRVNNIDTFEGLDFIHIGGHFYCYGNPIWGVWELFRDHAKFKFFNDCDPIREDRVIILDRLNFFLDYIDKPTVKRVKGYKCI